MHKNIDFFLSITPDTKNKLVDERDYREKKDHFFFLLVNYKKRVKL